MANENPSITALTGGDTGKSVLSFKKYDDTKLRAALESAAQQLYVVEQWRILIDENQDPIDFDSLTNLQKLIYVMDWLAHVTKDKAQRWETRVLRESQAGELETQLATVDFEVE